MTPSRVSNASSSEDEEEEPVRWFGQRRSHIIFYVMVTLAAVLLYIAGVMPAEPKEVHPTPAVIPEPAKHEVEMSEEELPSSSGEKIQPEEDSPLFKMLPEKVQDWYFKQKSNLQEQLEEGTTVTYYKSPHHLVKSNVGDFLKAQENHG
mmetsp:Transcript_58731/g.109999  ORF Transcript_58731/g.109999 Transcript_58731/m.109999 type:complete len:149 (-) Transcript_58731:22-468(-)